MPQDESRALGWRQALHRLRLHRFNFAAQQRALRIGRSGRHLYDLLFRIALFSQPVFGVDAVLADAIESAVDRDPINPGTESCSALEAGQPLIAAQKRLL